MKSEIIDFNFPQNIDVNVSLYTFWCVFAVLSCNQQVDVMDLDIFFCHMQQNCMFRLICGQYPVQNIPTIAIFAHFSRLNTTFTDPMQRLFVYMCDIFGVYHITCK